jgi:periplasmic protein TonB
MKSNRDTLIGFGFSVVLHGALLAAVIFSATQEKVQTASAPKSVTISLSSLSEVVQEIPKKKVCDKPKKKHKKHKEHKKIAHKPKPSPKKVLKEAVIPVEKTQEIVQETKEEVVEKTQEIAEIEPIEEINELEEAMIAAQELQKKEQEAQELAQSLHEEFVKTNFEMIREKVLANLSYPRIAKRMGFEGVVHIMLVIDTSGKLLDVMLEKSSGHKLLDSSALKAANKLSEEILPNPKNISRVTLPVYFALK